MAHKEPATSRHVQVSVHQGISPATGSSPVSRVHWENTSQIQDGPSVSPVEVDSVLKERAPVHSMTARSKCCVLQVIIITHQFIGVSAVLMEPTRLNSDRTTAFPVLETPPQTLTEPSVCLSARIANAGVKSASSLDTSSHPTIPETTQPMWSVCGPSTLHTNARF